VFTITKEVLDSQEALLTVEIEETTVQTAMQKAARKIAAQESFPGFRKGKVPYHIVVNRVGEPALRREAADMLLEESYEGMLKQAEVQPVGPGMLEHIQLEPLTLKIRVPLEPVVELGDYSDLRLEMELPEVTEAELAEALADLQEQHTIAHPVSRPAAVGDQITLGEVEARANGEVFIHDHDVNLVLDPADDRIISGMVDALLGLSAGEEKLFHLTLPEDFSEPALRNADAEFTVQVESVDELLKPALDDAFASVVGNFETLDALKTDLRGRMLELKQNEAYDAYHQALLQALVERATVKYPEFLVTEKMGDLLEVVKERVPRQLGLPWNDFLRLGGMTEEQYRETLRPNAEKYLTEDLVLEEFARREGITVSEQELRERYDDLLAQLDLPAGAPPEFSMDLVVVQDMQRQLLHTKAMLALERLARGLPALNGEVIAAETDAAPTAA